MKKKILIINRGAQTDNLGDRAINFTLTKLLERKGNVVISENYIKLFANFKILGIELLINLVKMFQVIKKRFDIVVIGGGQLILSNKKFPISFLTWILLTKLFSKAKIVVYGVGATNSFNKFNKICFKLGFFFVENIYVRDEVSKLNLMEVFNIESTVIPDVVTVIKNVCNPINEHEYSGNILFGITHYKSINRYGYMNLNESSYLKNQADLLFNNLSNGDIVLIANTKPDYTYAIKFKEYLYNQYKYDIDIYESKSLSDHLCLLKNSEKVISSRMHALIIAQSFGVDVLPVIRNKKLETFVTEYLSDWLTIDFEGRIDSSLDSVLRQ